MRGRGDSPWELTRFPGFSVGRLEAARVLGMLWTSKASSLARAIESNFRMESTEQSSSRAAHNFAPHPRRRGGKGTKAPLQAPVGLLQPARQIVHLSIRRGRGRRAKEEKRERQKTPRERRREKGIKEKEEKRGVGTAPPSGSGLALHVPGALAGAHGLLLHGEQPLRPLRTGGGRSALSPLSPLSA